MGWEKPIVESDSTDHRFVHRIMILLTEVSAVLPQTPTVVQA
jgi:hypothetical protein